MKRSSKSKSLKALAALSLMLICQTSVAYAQDGRAPIMVDKVMQSTDPRAVRVLFIGNSITFAHSFPRMFASLVKQCRPSTPLAVTMVAGPSYTLQDHYEELTAIKAIREGKWQYVVVQNVGALAGADPATFERYQTAFDREIRGIRAQPIIFEGYEDIPTEESQSVLKRAYKQVSARLRDPLLPVGTAMRAVNKQYPQIRLLAPDQHHPDKPATYLMCCLLYSYIFKSRPDLPDSLDYFDNGNTAIFKSDNPRQTAILRDVAWQVMQAQMPRTR